MPRSTPSSTEPVLLSDRDEAVLHSLVLHPLMSFDQLHRLHFPGLTPKPAKRCLARLREAGFAVAITGGALGHRRVWYPTAEAHAVLGRQVPRARGSVRGTSKVRHALAVNEF